jgi:hypothetical protein
MVGKFRQIDIFGYLPTFFYLREREERFQQHSNSEDFFLETTNPNLQIIC